MNGGSSILSVSYSGFPLGSVRTSIYRNYNVGNRA
jgi:hypothetical protein